ncbi:hypothetical protein [Methylovulum sp.]|uniref:hypothetical protein n=1 Tax=Methylovulum sp. TaxID=1916980 RepID=UPI0026108E69|nr:hypothetical protein [Methylovulum sp.]
MSFVEFSEATDSGHPGMCPDIAVTTEGMGMVQVAEMVKEIQLTSNTNTSMCR